MCRGNWKVVRDCSQIQSAVVNAKPKSTVLLTDEENWRRERTLTALNYSLIKHLTHLPLYFIFLKIGLAIGAHIDQLRVR